MKKIALIMTIILVALAVTLWAGKQIRAAEAAAQDFFTTLARGEVPSGLSGSVQELADNLLEFGPSAYTVSKVKARLTSVSRARTRIVLERGSEAMEFSLTLEGRGGWRPSEAPGSTLVVEGSPHPRLLLQVGKSSLSQELQALGTDKLLTQQKRRTEWLNLGWQEHAPYFASFQQGKSGGLVLGMEEVELYSHGGKLAAALMGPHVPDTIRVNLSTSGHQGIRHSSAVIRSSHKWQVTEAVTGRRIDLAPGSVQLFPTGKGISMDSQEFEHRLIFSPRDAEGQLELSSVTRSGGPPAYYGSLEVANFDGELVIVNELPLERYLWFVVPGEMPAYFGGVALEVQAIAARTFALGNYYASKWRETSAHVVDSVLSQVYNNGGTNSAAIAAVEASRGEYAVFNGQPVEVRYFSTSSGYTANAHEVWPDGAGNFPGPVLPYLLSRAQYPGAVLDIDDDKYADFLANPPAGAYDANSPWFRWQTTIPIRQLEGIIRDNLKTIFAASPASVLKRNAQGDFVAVQEIPADPVGELLDLVPAQRGEGGVLMAVDIVGSLGTWRVQREYYIRHVLRPQGSAQQPIEIIRHDGSTLKNFSLLPSAFVAWERQGEEYRFIGGGFGHGVGMSQYGVRELARQGWTREQIIRHYFPGAEVITLP